MQLKFNVFLCLLIMLWSGLTLSQQKNLQLRSDNTTPVAEQTAQMNRFVSVQQSDNLNAIWTESFNSLTLPAGWLNLQVSGTGLWTFPASGTYPPCSPHSGAGMASFSSYDYSTGVAAALISLSFSLTAGQGKLGFWMMRDGGYSASADKVDFFVNTSPVTTGATLLGTINRSKSLAPVETGADGWYYYEFPIPASFNTAVNYVILKGTSAYGNNIFIDDVSVSTILANDVGVVSIDSPHSHIYLGTVTPKITVKNFGASAQTFPVTLTIVPSGYSSTITVNGLSAGATLQILFPSWNASNGTYTVSAGTNLPTDQNRVNDTLSQSTFVSYSGWIEGQEISSGSYMGAASGYMRNDTGWIICTGGISPNLNLTKIYNVKTDQWFSAANMPSGTCNHGMAMVKDTAYVIGGYGTGSTPTTTFLKYNIRNNTWSSGTPLASPIAWEKAVSYQDSLIYIAGGYDGTNVLSNVSVYNVYSNTWRACTPLPWGKIGGAFALNYNTLVYVGGATISAATSDTYTGTISQTDRSVITWTTSSPYPGGTMYRFDAAPFYTNSIIVGGGSPSTAWTPATPNPVYTYNIQYGNWIQKNNVPIPVLGAYTGCVNMGGDYYFVLASGYTYNGVITNTQVCKLTTWVGINENGIEIPNNFSVSQNYPNPFNPVTRIDFALPESGMVTIKVYNILGKEVATLVNEMKNAGNYTVSFNASNLSSGMYFYRIEANGFSEVKKMVLVK